MQTDSVNLGQLKLDLFCQGARLADEGILEQTRPVKRTRGGLGSGLDAILPDNTWVNIPLLEPFAAESPFCLKQEDNQLWLLRNTTPLVKVELPARPQWYDQTTSSGKRMDDIGVMQGTYFAVYPSNLCAFWEMQPKKNCRFCSVGLCLGETESIEKSVQDVVEAVKCARRHERITFVHFNTGFFEDDSALDVILPYVKAVKQETGLLVGVQCPPAVDLRKYDTLKDAGADHVSFCFELFDPSAFADICPGKAECFGRIATDLKAKHDPFLLTVKDRARQFLGGEEPHPGQLVFYRALLYCLRLWRKGQVSGEIIAGLESPERSMAAIDFLASLGAVSTVCVFRPCIGTDLADRPAPDAQELRGVFARMYDACIEHGIPFGIAPNIRTAMVHLPEEGRWLSSSRHGTQKTFHALKCGLGRAIFGALCRARIKG